MRAWRLVCQLGILGSIVAAAIHCGTDNGSTFNDASNTAACKAAYAGKCGIACTDDNGCGDGLYCNAQKICTADCAPSVACDNGSTCSTRGQCVTGGTIGGDNGDGGPLVLADGAVEYPDGAVCASTNITLAKTEPYVLFALDQSGSMQYEFFPDNSTTTRLAALKKALVGANEQDTSGLLYKLQGNAQVEALFYSASTDTNNSKTSLAPVPTDPVVCPRFNGGHSFATTRPSGLQFADNNYAALSTLIRSAQADDDTPTGDAIQALVGIGADGGINNAKGFAAYDAGTAPKIVILVTDGQAGACKSDGKTSTEAITKAETDQGFAKTLAVVQQTKAQHISTYYIFIGSNDETDTSQTKQIANAGVGQDLTKGDASAYTPTNAADLASTLSSIVTNARSCTFAVQGTITDGSRGTVTLNGATLVYNTDWKVETGGQAITLLGNACNTIKTNPDATLNASFPCGANSGYVPPLK